jgi:ferritin-like metal-binding protein YciE
MRSTTDAINSYITDMLSLEEHIDKAVKGQIEDLKDYPEVVAELRMLQRGVHHHLDDLKQLRERRGGATATDAIKRAGSSILGLAAGAIDLVRNEGLPKNLRDDYTAFSLAGVGYVMLHTTALALGDQEVADLANQHLGDCTKAVIRLNDIIPPAVVRFLHQEGLPARPDVLQEVSRNVRDAWRVGETEQGRTAGEATIQGTPSY